ncbi:MAG TPA: hypothetical protein VFT74_21675, partial [Isosphaeraceae bacterium]|nr:hypothetical protein [Isosphaeraceae bacterium]
SGASAESAFTVETGSPTWHQIAAAPDGTRFAAEMEAGDDQRKPGHFWIVLFDGATCKEISRSPELELVGFSPDGKTYFTRSWESAARPDDSEIEVHDSASGKVLRRFKLQAAILALGTKRLSRSAGRTQSGPRGKSKPRLGQALSSKFSFLRRMVWICQSPRQPFRKLPLGSGKRMAVALKAVGKSSDLAIIGGGLECDPPSELTSWRVDFG